MASINLKQVAKRFGEAVIIPGLDLDIQHGEFVVFVGPSGCGKSTLLRLIAGLEDVSGGVISIEPEEMVSRPAMERSSVDLPQPEGPTKATKLPFAMLRSMPLSAWKAP